MITVTEAAQRKFLEILEAEGRVGHGLRVIVRNGGTAEPEFALNFVAPDDAGANDTVVDLGTMKVHVDPVSAKFLDGASVDYLDTITESGFKVDAPNAGIPAPSGPVAEAVQRVIAEKINPAVASHGGRVALVAIDGDTAYLRFGGGCQGCGMVNVTLKQGIERVLVGEVPEIRQVRDVTDHASGTNPYHQPAK